LTLCGSLCYVTHFFIAGAGLSAPAIKGHQAFLRFAVFFILLERRFAAFLSIANKSNAARALVAAVGLDFFIVVLLFLKMPERIIPLR